jgi:hypothetical protein
VVLVICQTVSEDFMVAEMELMAAAAAKA